MSKYLMELTNLESLDWDHVQSLLQERRTQYGLVAGAVSLYLLYRMLRKKNNLPPGPFGWPLLGNMISVRNMALMNKRFVEWRAKYGDAFTIYMGPAPFVILASKEAIREAFVTKGNDFAGRIHMNSMDMFSDGGKDIAMAQPTPIWKLQRQIAHAAIRKYASGQTLEAAIENSFNSVVHHVAKAEDGVIEIKSTMLKMAYSFIGSTCFGRQYEFDDPILDKLLALVKEAEEVMANGFISDFIPSLKFLDRAKIDLMERFKYEFYDQILGNELEEHEKTVDYDDPRDLTDEILIQIQKQKTSPEKDTVLNQLTKTHFIQLLGDVFSAGADTTRVTLVIVTGLMAQYPEKQAKMQRELDDILGGSGQVTLKMKDKLAYTNAVIHEAMRIQPVAPVGLPHTTTCDTTIGKYDIPKGTTVVSHIHGVHNDPENFENPDTFQPERWIDENGKFQYQPFKFIPFSMGPRVCLGESLARADLQIFTALFFHKFKVEPIGEEKFTLPLKEIMMGCETDYFKLKLTQRH